MWGRFSSFLGGIIVWSHHMAVTPNLIKTSGKTQSSLWPLQNSGIFRCWRRASFSHDFWCRFPHASAGKSLRQCRVTAPMSVDNKQRAVWLFTCRKSTPEICKARVRKSLIISDTPFIFSQNRGKLNCFFAIFCTLAPLMLQFLCPNNTWGLRRCMLPSGCNMSRRFEKEILYGP